MRLRKKPHLSLAGGPFMLRKGWPHDPAKNAARWPHDPANWQMFSRAGGPGSGGMPGIRAKFRVRMGSTPKAMPLLQERTELGREASDRLLLRELLVVRCWHLFQLSSQ